ncbi:MAG: rhodanese-like domain-containing protein [Chloroflexi bacterium]|nr:MAG: rhodanese-like domain-containing protein [Chloroflexota bacterium]
MSENSFPSWLSSRNFDYWSKGEHKIMPQSFFEKWARGEAILLDVRYSIEVDHLHLPFSLQIPISELPQRLSEIPLDKVVATFCSGGDRAAVAYAYLQSQGFENCRIFKGGYADLMAELMPGKLRKLKYMKA